MKKIILFAILIGIAATNVNAQRRSLKTEDDGFQYYKTMQGSYEGAESVDGKTLIPLSRQYTLLFYLSKPGHKGYFKVKKGDKYGACDIYGREIIAPQYEKLYYLSDGFSWEDSEGKDHYLGITLDANGRASSYGHTGRTSSYASTSSRSSSSYSSSSSSSSGVLFQGTYYSDGNGTDFLGNYYRGPVGTYNIVVYKDHIVVNGQYCEYAGSKEWERKTGRAMAFGYSWNHTTNSYGYPHDEFIQVDEKTQEITLFCRDMHPSGIPTTCHIKMKQGSYNGSPNQYQPSYQQPQYQNPYQQQEQNQSSPQPTPTPQRTQCGCCGGTGRVEKDDAISLGFQKKYCNECRREVFASHYHAPCNCCNGRGYLK